LARATTSRRNFSFGTTQYSAALGGTYSSERERKQRLAEKRRQEKRDAMEERRAKIEEKKLRAQELLAEAKVKAAERKITAVEKVADRKIDTAEKKIDAAGKRVDKGALTEAGFEAIKARMEREIAAQEEHKRAAVAKYGNPMRNTSFGYGVYTPGVFGEDQIAHFSSKAAAETWARSNDVKRYKIKRAFAKNPAVSGAQYRLAQAVLSGTARESTMPRAVAQEIVGRTPSSLRSAYTMGTAGGSGHQPGARSSSLRNPEPQGDDSEEYRQASRTAELFHGRPVKEEIEVKEVIKTHDWYVSIGPLIKLIIKPVSKKPKKRVPLPFNQSEAGTVQLFCSPDGRQFYLRGGDQELDLKAFGMDEGTRWFRDHMLIGEAVEITYRDKKKFHSFKLTDYYHKLGEETGEKPTLAYDTLSKKLSIIGGQYHVEMDDLVDDMSPGIVN
jgi:hypothetical protein